MSLDDGCTWGTADLYQDVTFGRTGLGSMPLTWRLEDVGMEIDDGGDEADVHESRQS
ncbi:hypothetical protein PISMIDRAFT_689744 [Pisolithus microcarpus 441]|uniref:Uncharacterized protein n=1 Tax=Pisolithus microcarpus 441 TaxID=765257 RepID=A0A0C9YE38_9AGAM|nr:hypothetical protein PISMIDRAFT_689744 [Pisolithus microcarpus 441]